MVGLPGTKENFQQIWRNDFNVHSMEKKPKELKVWFGFDEIKIFTNSSSSTD
jgi:hypothetical protein